VQVEDFSFDAQLLLDVVQLISDRNNLFLQLFLHRLLLDARVFIFELLNPYSVNFDQLLQFGIKDIVFRGFHVRQILIYGRSGSQGPLSLRLKLLFQLGLHLVQLAFDGFNALPNNIQI